MQNYKSQGIMIHFNVLMMEASKIKAIPFY